MTPTIREIVTRTGTVWVRVDGGNVAAMDWTDGTSQADIDAAVTAVAGR